MSGSDNEPINCSIIIPCYNESDSINSTLESLFTNLSDKQLLFEIIVVDDGSTDTTSHEIKKFPVILEHHSKNQGYGAALKTGIRRAKNDIVVITDADGTYPIDRIPDLIERFCNEKQDMVVGARVGTNVKIPLIRKPAKWAINKLANYLTRETIPDLNSGLRVMKKKVVEKYFHLLPDGFSFTSTITLIMLTKSYNVIYEPIDYFARKGKSKIRPFHDTLNFIQLIIRITLYFDPLRVFVTISLPLILLGFLIILFQAIVNQNISTIAVIISMTGIQLMAIGMIADLIVRRN